MKNVKMRVINNFSDSENHEALIKKDKIIYVTEERAKVLEGNNKYNKQYAKRINSKENEE